METEKARIRFEELNEQQQLMLAFETAYLMQRAWFSKMDATSSGPGLFPPPDRLMCTLLMNVYAYWLSGAPLHKRAACAEMGADDIKTGRKYISRAQELGLIDALLSPADKRKELLYPTDRLKEIVASELSSFSSRLLRLANYISKDVPITDNDAVLMREMAKFSSEAENPEADEFRKAKVHSDLKPGTRKVRSKRNQTKSVTKRR